MCTMLSKGFVVFRFIFTYFIFSVCAIFCVDVAQAGKIGIIPLPKDADAVTIDNYVQAIKQSAAAGSTITLTAPTWSEMEPSPGVYAMDAALGGSTYAMSQGMGAANYLGIQLINTSVREVPADLAAKRWDDPWLLYRFAKLVAALKAKGIVIKGVSVGNEVDVYFASHPLELAPYIRFLLAAKPILKAYFPGVRVGTTVTFEGLKTGRNSIISSLVAASDMVFFTYYPVINLKPLPIAEIPSHINLMVAAAGSKPMVLQEIGYPASVRLGSSDAQQASFFTQALPLLKKSTQIEASFIFALHDYSPAYCEAALSYYGASGLSTTLQNGFRDFLCTLGLIRNDGLVRPSYDTVRKMLIP